MSCKPAAAAAEPSLLRRVWRARSPEWTVPATARLGIGVITCERLGELRRTIEAVIRHTGTPFHLVAADDASTDGTFGWCLESGIPCVTGRRRGVAWNKNRALYALKRLDCERILLIEDDTRPTRDGWERAWLEALEVTPHLSFTPPGAFPQAKRGAPYGGLPRLDWLGGTLMAFTREALETGGYLDTRFGGYGHEHVELTRRYARLGLHPPIAEGYVTLDIGDAGLTDHPPPAVDAPRRASVARNWELLQAILREPPAPAPPARGAEQWAALWQEQARAAWPHERQAPLPRGQERRSGVSLVCPTRTEALARRLWRSIAAEDRRLLADTVWIINGEGALDLPGTLLRWDAGDFRYAESVNVAAAHTSGNVLWIVNDDVEMRSRGWATTLLEAYDRDPRLGAVFGGAGEAGRWRWRAAPEAPGWQGCCWAIAWEAFAAMGGLEESLIRYGGDEPVTAVRLGRLGFGGARLEGWRYRHDQHATYRDEDMRCRNIRELCAALGYRVDPALGDDAVMERFPAIWQQMRDGEGW